MKIKIFVLLFLSVFASSCEANDAIQDDGVEGINIANFPVIDGSDSTDPLRKILMCHLLGFEYDWVRRPYTQDPNADIKQVIPQYTCTSSEQNHLKKDCLKESNTHSSFIALLNNEVELIIVARSISRDEKVYAEEIGVELIEKPIAKDALAFLVNPTNPIMSLTIDQIQGIYTGYITNWNSVGGNNDDIMPFVRNANSGSQEKFETMVMPGLIIKDFPELQVGLTMMSPYYQIEEYPNAIGFSPFYYYNVIVDNNSTKAIGVNGVAMTQDNIKNGSYPYTSEVYAAVRSGIDRNSMAYKIFEYLTSSCGQKVIEESGYIPLSTVSSVQSVSSKSIKISNNNNLLMIDSPTAISSVALFDMNGINVMQDNSGCVQIDLSKMQKGFYLVKIKNEEGVSTYNIKI